ncbi:MAG: chorismate mutase [Verrucomicrobia bacterium]|nr:chorismate mutase [Verrucomicrobiota bacterium]
MSAPTANTGLFALRHAIDGIDDALAGLLACRVCLSHQAQALKARAGLPALDRAREVGNPTPLRTALVRRIRRRPRHPEPVP